MSHKSRSKAPKWGKKSSKNYEAEEILDMRGNPGEIQYFVKWKGYGIEQATWEPEKNLNKAKELIEQYLKLSNSQIQDKSLKKQRNTKNCKTPLRQIHGRKRKISERSSKAEKRKSLHVTCIDLVSDSKGKREKAPKKKREKKAVEKHKEERKKTTRRNRGKSECKAKGRPPKAKKETKAEALKRAKSDKKTGRKADLNAHPRNRKKAASKAEKRTEKKSVKKTQRKVDASKKKKNSRPKAAKKRGQSSTNTIKDDKISKENSSNIIDISNSLISSKRKSFVVQHSKKLAYKKPSHKVTDRKSFLMNPKGRKSMTKVNIRINKQLLKQRVEKLINKNTEQTGNRKPRKKNIDKETGMQVEIGRNSTENKAEKAEMLKGPDDSRNSGDHHDTSSTEKDEETADLKSLTSTIAQFINMISVDSTPVTKTIQISKSIVSLLGKSNYSSFIEPNSYVLPVINGLPPEGKYEVVVRPVDDRKKEFKAHNVSVVKNKDREEFTCMLWRKREFSVEN
ncbi:unnamed protein product [Moneuplotes crassus]|uniref:Chromo domain-containing protein n=1 Tax=Euplotes crassus TaxID=5936 RepID=A0AAD1XMR6_EUPCR|nr:unnamed protein product [Moneuplotes crassus]